MNNSIFGKTMGNVRKHRDIKLITREKKEELSGVRTKFFHGKKTEILLNKPVYLGLSIIELSKLLMYEFWYNYTKTKYGEKAKLCYIDTDSFMVYVKTDDIYKDIAEKILKTENINYLE